MGDISVKDQIETLIGLQKLDTEIYELKVELEEKPQVIAQLKENFELKKARLNGLEDQIKALQLDRKQHELELKEKEEGISNSNAKLSKLKTNKEYTAMISEIENIKVKKSILEENILNSYDDADKVNAQIEEEQKNVSAQEKIYLEKKKEVDDEMAQHQDRIKVLDGQRGQITPKVEASRLSMYEKILVRKQGLAIAPIHGNTCGGCFMMLTVQDINQLKLGVEILQCEKCQRILYIGEDENS